MMMCTLLFFLATTILPSTFLPPPSRGEPIGEYVGEIIKKEEQLQRNKLYKTSRPSLKCEYFMSVRGDKRAGPDIILDPTLTVCILKYANHSCNPNSVISVAEGNAFLMAVQNINIGEEICFHYDLDGDHKNVDVQSSKTKRKNCSVILPACRCGSGKLCRKYLY